jgi:drug/metabolite transporter (DMT)-like permease
VLIAVIWGTTFTVVHESVAAFPPLALIALRFGFAAAVFGPRLVRERRALSRSALGVGTLLGGLLFAGFATQTYGLALTTPARAGFITGLNVVLVPLLGLCFGQRPPRRALVGVLIAVVGMLVLSWGSAVPGAGAAGAWRGDLLILACAFAFAMHIVAVSRWSTQLPVLPVNTVQLLVVALLAAAASLAFDRPPAWPSLGVLGAALYLGVVATALVFALQLRLQRHTSATHTALIFALEPVFAALFSWLWTGEALTAAVLLGGGLMLLGVVAAEVPMPGRRQLPVGDGAAGGGQILDGDL